MLVGQERILTSEFMFSCKNTLAYKSKSVYSKQLWANDIKTLFLFNLQIYQNRRVQLSPRFGGNARSLL
jgi:hypothetical protein